MSTMQDGDILSVLQKAVTAAVAASTMPALPVKYVARTFASPDNQKWLEVVFLPNNRSGDFWGGEKNYRGMLRLILHWPNDDQGAYAPMTVLASVAGYFDKGTLLQNVQIYDNPDLTGVIENGSENLFPCTIRYQSYRT